MTRAEALALGRQVRSGQRRARLEDYAEIERWGTPIPDAARRLNVCERTIIRYRLELGLSIRREA